MGKKQDQRNRRVKLRDVTIVADRANPGLIYARCRYCRTILVSSYSEIPMENVRAILKYHVCPE